MKAGIVRETGGDWSYIYSERARMIVPCSRIIGLEIHKCLYDTHNMPDWFHEDCGEDAKESDFPYTIRIWVDGNGFVFINYGYYVDDLDQIRQELETLAYHIFGGDSE